MSKRKGLVIFLAAAFFAALALRSFLNRIYVVPILMYHSISLDAVKENRLSVSPASFQRQMHFLRSRKYNVIPLDELAALIRNKKKIPPKTVAITLDDGYKNNYTYGFPVLKKYNIPATMFIIVNEVGRLEDDRLTWEEIKAMQASGLISFGSHCLGPEPLINIKFEKAIEEQIFDSKKILEERLGMRVNLFSYPEGRFNEGIKSLVIKAGYEAAVAVSPGKKFPNNDVYALKRLRISSTSDNLFVLWVNLSGYYSFIKERRDSD
ncbi:MAG: polysaccharide deacetylase family protein [Candidatus Omnitrophota bacterium]|nr:polysaccharide deacetylase family protein [Candidatus Omnitrophota bacterium]